MPINKKNLALARRLLGDDHASLIVRMADTQDKLENKWDLETKHLRDSVIEQIIKDIESGKPPKLNKKMFEQFVLSHYFNIIAVTAKESEEELQTIDAEKKLAKPKIPRSLAEVRKIYDVWRRTGRMPPGLRDQANKIKDHYLNKVQKVWRRYSEDYRAGEEGVKAAVVDRIKKAAETATSRARTIVRTESTNYANDVRSEIYDQADGVTHYLFLAIRDQGTTKWCSDRVTNGKRGRHGLVYEKNDPLTKKERPSCHWNCRSEMVPLTPYNPRHQRLIEDESNYRRNNVCHPLPKGWG